MLSVSYVIFQIFSEDIAEYYRETTGLHVTENFLLQDMPEEWLYYPDFLDQPEVLFHNVSHHHFSMTNKIRNSHVYVISTQVRKAIHVGDTVYYDKSNHSILVDDIPKPSTQTLKSLIEVKSYKVWSPTQFLYVDFSKSTISVKKVRFQQTHNQGLCQLLLTVSWDLRA